jgi:hypothetical protein
MTDDAHPEDLDDLDRALFGDGSPVPRHEPPPTPPADLEFDPVVPVSPRLRDQLDHVEPDAALDTELFAAAAAPAPLPRNQREFESGGGSDRGRRVGVLVGILGALVLLSGIAFAAIDGAAGNPSKQSEIRVVGSDNTSTVPTTRAPTTTAAPLTGAPATTPTTAPTPQITTRAATVATQPRTTAPPATDAPAPPPDNPPPPPPPPPPTTTTPPPTTTTPVPTTTTCPQLCTNG